MSTMRRKIGRMAQGYVKPCRSCFLTARGVRPRRIYIRNALAMTMTKDWDSPTKQTPLAHIRRARAYAAQYSIPFS